MKHKIQAAVVTTKIRSGIQIFLLQTEMLHFRIKVTRDKNVIMMIHPIAR